MSEIFGAVGAALRERVGTLAQVMRVDSFIEAEGAAPATIVGHSFGGATAVVLADRRPELVNGLLLVAPAGVS